jgi:hypothetical protein
MTKKEKTTNTKEDKQTAKIKRLVRVGDKHMNKVKKENNKTGNYVIYNCEDLTAEMMEHLLANGGKIVDENMKPVKKNEVSFGTFEVGRLVASTFLKNPDNKPYVRHIDGNKLNNNVNNLEWSDKMDDDENKNDSKKVSDVIVKSEREELHIEPDMIFKTKTGDVVELYKINYGNVSDEKENNPKEIKKGGLNPKPDRVVEDATGKQIELYKINEEGLDGHRISICGKVWSSHNEKFLNPQKRNGYKGFSYNGGHHAVHRLVAKTFVANTDDKPYVNHIDENKLNNDASNLEWVSQKENTQRHCKEISHSRQVKQIDPKTGEVVKIFDQVSGAATAIKLTPRAIQLVLNGQNKSAGGYYWEYVNADNYADNLTVDDLKDAKKVYTYKNYYVFKDGRIYNSINKKFLKPVLNASGRQYVTFSKDQSKKNCYVQRVVADHFLPNKPCDNSEVVHINGITTDNRVENLKWSNKTQKNVVVMPMPAPVPVQVQDIDPVNNDVDQENNDVDQENNDVDQENNNPVEEPKVVKKEIKKVVKKKEKNVVKKNVKKVVKKNK